MKKWTRGQRTEGRRARTRAVLSSVLCPLLICLLAGCRQQMARQAYYHWPDMPSDFFPDGSGNRPVPPGTAARGSLRTDDPRFAGQKDTGGSGTTPNYVTDFPYPVTLAMLERGRERFNIYCAVCHGRNGEGDGIIVQRGYAKPPSYYDEKRRAMPVGQIFHVITNGYGAMPDYAAQVPPDDRWAVVAYIRALQYSRSVPANELTEQDREAIQKAQERSQPKAGAEGGHGD